MSSDYEAYNPCAAIFFGAGNPDLLLFCICQPWTDHRRATRDDNCAQELAKSPNNVKMGREETFHAVTDAVVTGERPTTFKQGPVALSTSDQFLVHDAITGTAFHTEKCLRNWCSKPSGYNRRESITVCQPSWRRLSSTLSRSWFGHHAAPKPTRAAIDIPGFMAPTVGTTETY